MFIKDLGWIKTEDEDLGGLIGQDEHGRIVLRLKLVFINPDAMEAKTGIGFRFLTSKPKDSSVLLKEEELPLPKRVLWAMQQVVEQNERIQEVLIDVLDEHQMHLLVYYYKKIKKIDAEKAMTNIGNIIGRAFREFPYAPGVKVIKIWQ